MLPFGEPASPDFESRADFVSVDLLERDQAEARLAHFDDDQEMWLRRHQAGKGWTWSGLRPQTVCGFALGNPMNISTVIAVHAAISKEPGLSLRFPGKPEAYDAIYRVTDSEHLAKAMMWCASAARAANQVFNVTTGDVFRWPYLWPRFAEFFRFDHAPPQTISLTAFMADKAPLWAGMVERHGLAPIPFAEVAADARGLDEGRDRGHLWRHRAGREAVAAQPRRSRPVDAAPEPFPGR